MSEPRITTSSYAKCRELLKPDGVMLLHTIGRLGKTSGAPDPFTDKYIFPGYHIPSLSQMGESSQKVRMIVSDVEILRLHYAYTLREWLRRTIAAKDKIVALYDERFFRMWEVYLVRRDRDVREWRRLHLPGAICPRPPRASADARLYGRGRGALPVCRRHRKGPGGGPPRPFRRKLECGVSPGGVQTACAGASGCVPRA